MAEDIKILWDADLLEGDIEFLDGDLLREGGLESAVLVSLFSDRRADNDDIVDDPNNRGGWWGDLTTSDSDLIGSKLWLLRRSKTTPEAMQLAKQYIYDALEWMIADSVASKIVVTIERQTRADNSATMAALVQIQKNDGTTMALKFDDLWEAQYNAVR
jgi:phage gp46-like protein